MLPGPAAITPAICSSLRFWSALEPGPMSNPRPPLPSIEWHAAHERSYRSPPRRYSSEPPQAVRIRTRTIVNIHSRMLSESSGVPHRFFRQRPAGSLTTNREGFNRTTSTRDLNRATRRDLDPDHPEGNGGSHSLRPCNRGEIPHRLALMNDLSADGRQVGPCKY